jgi:L-methionine (R)-S-oxide reductase
MVVPFAHLERFASGYRQSHRGKTEIGMSGAKSQIYRELSVELAALLEGETDRIANAANMAALIYHGLPGISWAGFYFSKGNELVLGPF